MKYVWSVTWCLYKYMAWIICCAIAIVIALLPFILLGGFISIGIFEYHNKWVLFAFILFPLMIGISGSLGEQMVRFCNWLHDTVFKL